MIHSERWKVWETNSSSMNQFVIHLINDVTGVGEPRHIELNYDIDDSGGAMYSDFPNKAKIIYTIIEQLKYEADYVRINIHDKLIEWANIYQGTFFEVLKSHGIEYTITESERDISEVDMFGLCGVSEISRLSDFASVEKFLFDPASMFTFGYYNDLLSSDEFGYTGIKISKNYYSTWNI